MASGDYSLLGCTGLSLWWFLLESTGSRHTDFSSCGSWALELRLGSCGHGFSCSTACGIFPDQGWNLCLLHRQVDSYLLHRQGSLITRILMRRRGDSQRKQCNHRSRERKSDVMTEAEVGVRHGHRPRTGTACRSWLRKEAQPCQHTIPGVIILIACQLY